MLPDSEMELSWLHGMMRDPVFGSHEKAEAPSPHELELSSRQDRSPRRRRIMAEFFRDIATSITGFEVDALKIFDLPPISEVRRATISSIQPDNYQTFTVPLGAEKAYKKRVLQLAFEILGEDFFNTIEIKSTARQKILNGTYPYQMFQAYTVGTDEAFNKLLREIDPTTEQQLKRRRIAITTDNPYYRAAIQEGGKRIKTELALNYMSQVIRELKLRAQGKETTIAAGRALHDMAGEGKLWYWMRITRSETALACNAAFQGVVEQYGIPYQRWSAGPGACEICTSFGQEDKIWPAGQGPEPVTDSHPHCMCHLETVWYTELLPQQTWNRPTPYEEPYTPEELEALRELNQEAEKP